MSLRQVYHIDVVAYAGVVGRIIVVAEYLELSAYSHGGLRHKRYEVHGHTVGQFANQCSGMGANGVEVAQDDALDGRATVDVVMYDFLVYLLRVAVWRQGLLDGRVLGNGQVLGRGLSVDGTRRREDDTLHIILRHEFQQVNQRGQVVAVVQQRLLHTFTHSLRGCEMDDALNLGVLLEHAFQGLKIAAVHLLEGRTHTRYLLNAVHDVGIRVREIVDDDYFIACLLQFNGGMAANKARTAGNKNCLFHSSNIFRLINKVYLRNSASLCW